MGRRKWKSRRGNNGVGRPCSTGGNIEIQRQENETMSRRQARWFDGMLAMMIMCAALAAQAQPTGSDCLAVINYATTPVYAMAVTVPAATLYPALGLPAGTPLEAVTPAGSILPLYTGQDDGQDVVRLILSLDAGERIVLTLHKAAQWGTVDKLCAAQFNAATGVASLSNGLVTFEYRNNKWGMAFTDPQTAAVAKPGQRQFLKDCTLSLWLDSERRGRLLGMTDEKVKETGLIHSKEGHLASGEAKIHPDGSATLQLTRSFEGFAKDVTWTETYTLLPGRPVMVFNLCLGTSGESKRYLAFVQHGGGVSGNFGNLLMGKLRFGYQDPREPKRLLLAGAENASLRIGWRNERCWFAADSELGSGIGISTTRDIPNVAGSRIWGLWNSGFFTSFLDTEQVNMPYEFSREKPLAMGFAYVGGCGGVSMWHQTRQLFAGITKGKDPQISSSCAVYLGNALLQAGEVAGFADASGPSSKMMVDGATSRAPLTVDFQRPYQLTASAEGVTAANPIRILARALDKADHPVEVMTLDQSGEKQIDLTGITKWEGKRQTFTLEIVQPEGARLTGLQLAPSEFQAPKLGTPIDGLALSDLAVFFRWQQVKGALDYELQLAKDEAFSAPKTITVRSEADWPYYMPKDEELPTPGTWFWRVRALEPGRPGVWSAVRKMTVNNEHAKKLVDVVISPERPLFTIEACRVLDLNKFKTTIPEDLKPYVAFNCHAKFDHIAYLKPLQEAGIKAFVRTHGPGPMSYWMPLADVEAVFQAYPNIIGIMGGETLTSNYNGGEMQVYANRLLKLCGKYGRVFYDADGTGPGENKWEALYQKSGALMNEYRDCLIFAQKNNIHHRQFVSQSSVLGLYLSDNILAQGAWEDGGWYWQQVGFRKLGDIRGQRGGDTIDMPRNFWNLNFLMGISRGCAVFSFEGQTGTTPVPKGWTIAEKGLPKQYTPTAYWTTEGELTPTFHRFVLPFMRAVIAHKLVPTKEQVLKNIRLAAYNDGVPKKEDGDQYYYEWKALYEGTYGFRDYGVIPGTLMEFFPNTGRYNYFPVFPQGKVEVKGIEMVPLSQLMDPATVKARFDKAYPEWYSGNALVTMVGDTLAVMNSNENTDVTENYSVPLKNRGSFANIAGKIATHSYLVGKFEDGNRSLWLQANAEYPERDTELTLTCKGQPQVKVTPAAAAKTNQWDASSGNLILRLSHAEGAVEVEITVQNPAEAIRVRKEQP